jgi:hypothetical protein
MKSHHFWLLLATCIAISITVGVVWGIYAASWVVGILTWIITECVLIWLLLVKAVRDERREVEQGF